MYVIQFLSFFPIEGRDEVLLFILSSIVHNC